MIYITAVNEVGESTASSTLTTFTLPGAPTGLTFSDILYEEATVSWSTPVGDDGFTITGYQVWIKTSLIEWTQTDEVSTTLTLTALPYSALIDVKVYSVTANGVSIDFVQDSFSTLTPPSPTGLLPPSTELVSS